MPLITDQTGNTVNIPFPPERIVSLVPSQTELLYDLGLDGEVVGITKFCVHPEKWFRSRTRIGGTKKLDLEKIRALDPALIIANREENEKEQVEALMREFPVWVSDIRTIEDAFSMIRSIGEITGRPIQAEDLINRISKGFRELRESIAQLNLPAKNSRSGIPHPGVRTAYLIWRDPWMVAGGDSFINGMMRQCGFKNVFEDTPRYPQILPVKDLVNCELILLSSEPYPFREKHRTEIRELLPAAQVLLVDGEMFSWYGSRMLHATGYFKHLAALCYSSR